MVTWSTASVSLDQWTFVAFSLDYQAGQTLTKGYYDGQLVYTDIRTFRLMDVYSAACQNIDTGVGNMDYFNGFLWRLTIYPYVRTFTADIVSPSCPAGVSYCLSPAHIAQTYRGENCAPSCSEGGAVL